VSQVRRALIWKSSDPPGGAAMRMPHTTALLTSLNQKARAGRALYDPPSSWFRQVSDTYAEMWFPSSGCIWDKMGHCTTCNYGMPVPVDVDTAVRAVEIAMGGIAPTTEVLFISAYDSLQEREVPAEARRRIFELVGKSPVRTVITETHPASVRAGTVAEVVAALDGRTFGVELGTETMNEFVRYACLNKPFSNVQLARAVQTIHDQGAKAWCNLIVGIPFLTREEVIDETAASIRDAFALGFDEVVLFPNLVKEYTLAYWLTEAGRYTPPDLWYLRDILAEVPVGLVSHVHFAWLDLKPHPGAARVEFESDRSATERLRQVLDDFNVEHDASLLDEAFQLTEPPRDIREQPGDLVTRLGSAYAWLADTYGEGDWWMANSKEVIAELRAGKASVPLANGA
jgi:archaeosine synthase beta-subunit